MAKKKTGVVVAGKARNLLRLALSWARKVAVFKGDGDKAPTDGRIHYLERQLSFDRSPDFRFKKDRRLTGSMGFLFPCVGAKAAEFDYDIAADEQSYLTEEEEEGEGEEKEKEKEEEEEDDDECNGCDKKSQSGEEGIDSRAEKFIAEFYGQPRFRN